MSAEQHQAYNSDGYMLGFVAKYVSEIWELEGKGHTVKVIYWPTQTKGREIKRSGVNVIEAFRKCIKGAMHVTDKVLKQDGGDREIYQSLN